MPYFARSRLWTRGVRVYGLGFRPGVEFVVLGLGFIAGLGCRSLGYRVWGLEDFDIVGVGFQCRRLLRYGNSGFPVRGFSLGWLCCSDS